MYLGGPTFELGGPTFESRVGLFSGEGSSKIRPSPYLSRFYIHRPWAYFRETTVYWIIYYYITRHNFLPYQECNIHIIRKYSDNQSTVHVRGCNLLTMKRRKLTAPHINTYWLLSQSSLRLGMCPECAEMLRECFLIAKKNRLFPCFALTDSCFTALRTAFGSALCICQPTC